MYDVIVIGGSYAGLAATLQLARARKQVLVIDAGQRRNRFARHSHGFLGQDGQPPGAIAAKGRAEVLAYPTVTWREGRVSAARAIAGGFAVHVDAEEHRARRLVLATGMVDELPAIPGLAERWGRTAFFCPYCDGYELDLGRLAVLGSAESMHYAPLVAEWGAPGQTTLFLNGAFEPSEAERAELAARAIQVEPTPIEAILGDAPTNQLRLRDGRVHAVDAIFLMPKARPAGGLAESLGCAFDTGKLGPMIRTDATKETTVPGVFACGDVALPMPSVSFAVGDGVKAGASVHQSLIFRK